MKLKPKNKILQNIKNFTTSNYLQTKRKNKQATINNCNYIKNKSMYKMQLTKFIVTANN